MNLLCGKDERKLSVIYYSALTFSISQILNVEMTIRIAEAFPMLILATKKSLFAV
jgi:hypothetical protein